MNKTTVRERPERQPDRFNVTFKRLSEGFQMTIVDVLYERTYNYQIDSLNNAYSKAKEAVENIRRAMIEENLLETGLTFK
jgi:flagellar biosynthesis/type III secretory pathway M-ring protein FliF/YscJ